MSVVSTVWLNIYQSRPVCLCTRDRYHWFQRSATYKPPRRWSRIALIGLRDELSVVYFQWNPSPRGNPETGNNARNEIRDTSNAFWLKVSPGKLIDRTCEFLNSFNFTLLLCYYLDKKGGRSLTPELVNRCRVSTTRECLKWERNNE